MMLSVSNPDAKAAYEKHREAFKRRASCALQREGLDSPDAELISQLADIAAILDLGGGSGADPRTLLHRALAGQLNAIKEDGQLVSRALRSLDNALNRCSEPTKIEIAEGLKAAGIEPEGLSAGLVLLQDIVRNLGDERAIKVKTGQVTEGRTVVIHRVWDLLEPLELGQRACSRIIAWLLDGSDANRESIYTAIHKYVSQG